MDVTTAPPRVSGIPKTMGILLIIFSSIYLLVSLISAGVAFFSQSFMDLLPLLGDADTELKKSGIHIEVLLRQLKVVYQIQGLEKLATAGLSGFALMAGIKLTQFTAQGLKLAVWWAISALAYLVLEVWIFILYINPLVAKLLKTLSEQVAPHLDKDAKIPLEAITGLAGSMGISSVIVSALMMAVFPVLMIVLLNNPSAKKACGVEKVFS